MRWGLHAGGNDTGQRGREVIALVGRSKRDGSLIKPFKDSSTVPFTAQLVHLDQAVVFFLRAQIHQLVAFAVDAVVQIPEPDDPFVLEDLV